MKKGYTEISPGMTYDGDIIKVKVSVYDENIVSKNWLVHFVERTVYARVIKTRNSAYTILAKKSDGGTAWFSLNDKRYIATYRKN